MTLTKIVDGTITTITMTPEQLEAHEISVAEKAIEGYIKRTTPIPGPDEWVGVTEAAQMIGCTNSYVSVLAKDLRTGITSRPHPNNKNAYQYNKLSIYNYLNK